MRRFACVLGVAVGAGTVAVPSQADAACGSGRGWDMDNMPIPVYINENLLELCDEPASKCSSLVELRQVVESATAEWYQESPSRIRFEILGIVGDRPGTRLKGAIHLFAGGCRGVELARTTYPLAAPGETSWTNIRICTRNGSGPLSWKPYGSSGDPRIPLHNLLLSELSHAIGMDDAESCVDDRRSVSSAILREDAGHIFPTDSYFIPDVQRRRWESRSTLDGEAWFKGPQPTMRDSIHKNVARMSATNGATSSQMFIWSKFDFQYGAYRYADQAWDLLRRWGWFVSYHYQSGIAARSGTDVAAARLGGYDEVTGGLWPRFATASDGVVSDSSWDGEPISDEETTNAGISVVYDPESDSYLTVWRGPILGAGGLDDMSGVNEIIYNVGGSKGPQIWSGVRAVAVPSVACGPSDQVGNYNCLMAWSSADSWESEVRFSHFRIAKDLSLEFSPEGIQTHGFTAIGGPSVGYYNGLGEERWLLALSQNGTEVYTWEKGPSASSPWINPRSFSVPGLAGPPAVGSQDFLVDQAHVMTMGLCPDEGASDYCSVCGPCDEGEGDCDGNDECMLGLICSPGAGPDHGLPSGVDVCECPVWPGHRDYCSLCGPCGTGDSGCSSNADCHPLTACSGVGPGTFRFCEAAPHQGEEGHCAIAGPCGTGVGDCDADDDCKGGRVCSLNVGSEYGLAPDIGVCECPWPEGDPNYCRDCGPCPAGSGSCGADSECEEGSTCSENVGLAYGLPAGHGVCEP